MPILLSGSCATCGCGVSDMIRPLLAVSLKNIREAGKELILPAYASPKVDGIRCLETPDYPQTKAGFSIPNPHIRNLLAEPDLVGLDGEITVGSLSNIDLCAITSGACMNGAGRPDFLFHLFDSWDHPKHTATQRNAITFERFLRLAPKYPFLRYLEQRVVRTMEEVEQAILDMAIGEGIILKRFDGLYKQTGRSTVNSQELVKIKPYEDDEGQLLYVIQGERNENEQKQDNFGYAKRSSSQSGKVLVDTAGALRCWSARWGEFNVSLGSLDHAKRKWIWDNREAIKGWIVTFRYLPIGSLDKPRHPLFKLFRDHRDM